MTFFFIVIFALGCDFRSVCQVFEYLKHPLMHFGQVFKLVSPLKRLVFELLSISVQLLERFCGLCHDIQQLHELHAVWQLAF